MMFYERRCVEHTTNKKRSDSEVLDKEVKFQSTRSNSSALKKVKTVKIHFQLATVHPPFDTSVADSCLHLSATQSCPL